MIYRDFQEEEKDDKFLDSALGEVLGEEDDEDEDGDLATPGVDEEEEGKEGE